MENLLEWLALSITPGLGPKACLRLVDHFGTPANIFKASYQELINVGGIKKSCLEFLARTPAFEKAERLIEEAHQHETTLISWEDKTYPNQLRNIADPPIVLFLKGVKETLTTPGLAIVGARASTSYGQSIASHLAYQLAQRGLAIISGLALGIDAAAHNGALSAGGKTLAVLGCGVDIIYPKANKKLYSQIMKTGALVSEYPFKTQPESFRFPARNRIISALSHGVLIVEAARHSGSLITAHFALEHGREVFAVPGRIDSFKSEGSHKLLQQGAKLVHSVDDILEELKFIIEKPNSSINPNCYEHKTDSINLSTEEEKIFALLSVYPKSIDEISREANMPSQKANEALLLLELKELVKSLPGKMYQKLL